MKTRITPISELKQIFTQLLLSNTNRVSKVSKGSVLNGIAYGVSKVGQKALKEAAVVEARKFPHSASGQYLDMLAADYGIASRFSASGSSTYICLVADVGTTYDSSVVTIEGSDGVSFTLDEDVVIGNAGYAYMKIRSVTVGQDTNVDPYSLSRITPEPTGHKLLFNEAMAMGGSDDEVDDVFRNRIIGGANILARSTKSSLEQAFMKINHNVLRVYYYGITDAGKIRLGVLAQNGVDFTDSELAEMLRRGESMFSWSDSRFFGSRSYGVELVNVQWLPVDVDFRVDLDSSYDTSAVRKELQQSFSRYLDYRFWEYPKMVEWDDLLMIVKSHKAVKYTPDSDFRPREDMLPQKDVLPRIRMFRMRDLSGTIISSYDDTIPYPVGSGAYADIYFGNNIDRSYGETVLTGI